MPNQRHQADSTYPEHVEQVRQNNEPKGDLVLATGSEWSGKNATDRIIMAAEPDSWVDLGLVR